MRTRSQPDSPGGFVSLDDMKNATRRTRTTRSASRAASQEPSTQGSSSQQSSFEQTTETAIQPTTRAKTQKRTTKKTTTKKTTSTSSTSKPQTRTSKRGTRSSKRKTDEAATEEAQENVDEDPLDSVRADNEDNTEADTEDPESGPTSDNALLEPKNSERKYNASLLSLISPPLSPSLSLPLSLPPFDYQEIQNVEDDPGLQLQTDLDLHIQHEDLDVFRDWDTYQGLLSATVPLELGEIDDFDFSNFPEYLKNDSDDEAALQESPWLGNSQDANCLSLNALSNYSSHDMAESREDIDDTNEDINCILEKAEKDLAASRSTEHQASSDTTEQLAALVTPTADLGQSNTNEADVETILQIAAAVPLPPDDDELDLSQMAQAAEAQSPKKSHQLVDNTTTSHDLVKSIQARNAIDELVEGFEKLSLSKNAPEVTLSEVLTTAAPAELPEMAARQGISNNSNIWPLALATSLSPMVSIYDPAPPSVPTMLVLGPTERAQQAPVFSLSIPDSHSSIYGDGQTPPTLMSGAEPDSSAGSPFASHGVRNKGRQLSRAQRRCQRRGWPNTPLSPIAEERDLVPAPSSSDGLERAVLSDQTVPECPVRPPTAAPAAPVTSSSTLPVAAIVSRSPGPPEPSPSNSTLATRPGLPSPCHTPEAAVKAGSKHGDSSTGTPTTPKSLKTQKASKTTKIQKTPRTPETQLQLTHESSQKSKAKKKLIKKKVNRKRSRTESSADENAEPVTPYANKRRNLGPPGSTPFARHLTPLARRLSRTAPRSERMLRRRAESQGRIHSTIFRLPEFVAQTEADRRASEASTLTAPSSEPLQTDLDTSSEQAQTVDETVAEKPATAQEPSTPEPAKSGWNFSGIFSSVPRSFSRFLPRFGRSPARSQATATKQPASERIRRTRPTESASAAASEKETQSGRRLSEQPPAKRARNLSFSLYPAKIDRSLYLGDIPSKSTASDSATAPAPAPLLQSVEQRMPQTTAPDTSITSSEQSHDAAPREGDTASELQKKKRKRSPSPDVIPNPAGSSYGMDLDYFCYSSDSDENEAASAVPQTEPRKADVHGKSSLRSVAQTERPAEKKKKNVHFGLSPEDTPSKNRRARATEPYTGSHFIGMGGSQSFSAPTTPTPASRIQDPRQRPGFVPNRSGTFELDYDAFSDDSESSGAPSPSSVPAPSPIPKTPTSTQPATPQSAQTSAPRSAARPPQTPSTQTPSTSAKFDGEALARVRSQAEKYKPKTPSGLRTTSRYSSPIVNAIPDATPTLKTTAAAEKVAEEFGDDHFAQEAQWLFENCPSGDLTQLKWPEPRPFGESLNASAESIRIVNEIWDPADADKAYAVFQPELADYKQTVA